MVRNAKDSAIYEDEHCVAFLERKSFAKGQVLVLLKEHFAIIELVPDYLVNHLFSVVNKLSVAAFDAFSVQGTNLLVNNGVAAGQEFAHVSVQIIPRSQSDDLDFSWAPKQLSEEEMSTIELSLREETTHIGGFSLEKPAEQIVEEHPTEDEEDAVGENKAASQSGQKAGEGVKGDPDEEDYELRQLNRVP